MVKPRSKGNRSVPAARFVLPTIAIILLASGAIRLGPPALAFANEALAKPPAVVTPEVIKNVDPEQLCAEPEGLPELFAAIRERQTDLDVRASQIAARMQALKVAEKKYAENTAALVKAEEQLAATLAVADQAAEKDIQRLTVVYENMKPKSASKLFETMAPNFAAGFLTRMRPDAAAGILSELPPDTAYSVSVIMAGRNARAPKQ